MKRNTVELVKKAQQGKGFEIDYLDEKIIELAKQPIERMLAFSSEVSKDKVAYA